MCSPPGMEKINFSGGEPFLQDRGEYLGELVRFCKEDLGLPSVSIVSNGSLIRERWFVKYGEPAALPTCAAAEAAFPPSWAWARPVGPGGEPDRLLISPELRADLGTCECRGLPVNKCGQADNRD